MIVKIDHSFDKDISILRDAKVKIQIYRMIEDVSKAISIDAIKNIKKIKGYKNYFRIRIGNYRAGLTIDGNTAEFIRFLHRKDIYKRFP